MRYLTDHKRAIGLGAAKTGTEHFWAMKLSSVALAILIPLFILTFGSILGEPYGEVREYFARPFPAIIAALTLTVGWLHYKDGVQVFIEDYVHGLAGKILIIGTNLFSWAMAFTSLYAILRIAL